MLSSRLNPVGSSKLNFPGFQEILDFTSNGSESSVSVAVDGDTDKEYRIVHRLGAASQIVLELNGVTTGNLYGRQCIYNNNGGISAVRDSQNFFDLNNFPKTVGEATLLTPTGLVKTMFNSQAEWTSGTTIFSYFIAGYNFNSTSNITLLNFRSVSGNFTSGTRITVFARRSNV